MLWLLVTAALASPQRVVIPSDGANLTALVYRPAGKGPFPAILLNHGGGRTPDELRRLGPYERNAEVVGPLFARHGYVLLYLFRRGVGPSTDQGKSASDLLTAAPNADARNAIQMDLLENREMNDATAALRYLRTLPGVDRDRIGIVGHSFGGCLTLLMAAREPALRAVVVFSAAGYSFDRSAPLRASLMDAVGRIAAPAMFVHAANDYSLSGRSLAAEMQRLGKPHELRIYPPFGRTADDGHDLPNRGVAVWEKDVFAFLDESLKR